jgi:hypothetical protein
MASADLLYTSCVLSTVNCNADAQIITEEFLPLLVHELETAQTAIDRLAAILSLGALYIRGEDVAARIAAIMSLKRLMDFSPDKVNILSANTPHDKILKYVNLSVLTGYSVIGFSSR